MTAYCVFNVSERRIGIPMTSVREIVEPSLIHPTPVPLTPPFVRGLFNLRGQVLPFLDLAAFVGAQQEAGPMGRDDRAVIIERGNFRFATPGRRIDTVEADPAAMQPLENAALYPALDAVAQTDRGNFEIVHLDRLEACLGRALKFRSQESEDRTQESDPRPQTPGPRPQTPDPSSYLLPPNS